MNIELYLVSVYKSKIDCGRIFSFHFVEQYKANKKKSEKKFFLICKTL